ncbi:MAG: hypothetical protein HKO80_03295 [Flavobacteriaceae bacterium]|nr:hypothetical protein [Flavobacteriaceae bacterium]
MYIFIEGDRWRAGFSIHGLPSVIPLGLSFASMKTTTCFSFVIARKATQSHTSTGNRLLPHYISRGDVDLSF